MATYQELREQLVELKKLVQAKAKEAFDTLCAEFFAANPEVDSFGWSQYTPYFNDGDTCTFGMNCDADSVEVNGVTGYDVPVDDGEPRYNASRGEWDVWRAKKKAAQVTHNKVEELLESIDSDDMESLFGDHVKVTVRRNGETQIDEYSHD